MNITSNMVVFYVNDIPTSIKYYSDLFGAKPVAETPGFAMFALEGGMMFGLWLRAAAEPKTAITGGGGELVVMSESRDKVDGIVQDWRRRGLVIGQDAVDAPFGYTAVALDPDQHRIRVLFDPNA